MPTFNTFGEALKYVRQQQGLTQREMAEKLGIMQPSLSMYETGGGPQTPNIDMINILGEWVGLIMVHSDGKFQYRVDEQPLQTTDVKKTVRNKETGSDVIVPYYSLRIHAGTSAPIYEEQTENFNVTKHYKGTTVYEVTGDSMIDANIEEGDRIVVRNGHAFRNKDIILCRYNEELQVKGAMIIDGRIKLFPANKQYHPWYLKPEDEFECIGTLIEIIKDPPTDWWRDVNKTEKGEE